MKWSLNLLLKPCTAQKRISFLITSNRKYRSHKWCAFVVIWNVKMCNLSITTSLSLFTNILVHCRTDTTREWLETSRSTRTGRETMVHESYNIGELHRYLHADDEQFCRIFFVLKAWESESPSNNMQFTNCTTRKPLFHDPYEWFSKVLEGSDLLYFLRV